MIATRPLVARLLTVATLGIAVAAGGFSAAPASAQVPAQDDQGTVETEWGPLTGADRDLLVRVMYANLWEIPAGEMAAEKGSTERVREVGTFIRDEHTELNEATLAIAAELQVALPTDPHPDHQVFLNRMEEFEGEDFDYEFVQRLREAHGEIYALIAFVRAGTYNDKIREFADVGEEFVNRHMAYLESTGLVEWLKIPPPPEPYGTKARFLAVAPAGVNPAIIWLILGVAAVAGTITVIRTVRPR